MKTQTSVLSLSLSHLQTLHKSVMFSEEDGMGSCQSGLFTNSRISTIKTESTGGLALVVLAGLRQEVLATPQNGSRRIETPINALAKISSITDVVAVDHGGVNVRCVLVELLSRTCKIQIQDEKIAFWRRHRQRNWTDCRNSRAKFPHEVD